MSTIFSLHEGVSPFKRLKKRATISRFLEKSRRRRFPRNATPLYIIILAPFLLLPRERKREGGRESGKQSPIHFQGKQEQGSEKEPGHSLSLFLCIQCNQIGEQYCQRDVQYVGECHSAKSGSMRLHCIRSNRSLSVIGSVSSGRAHDIIFFKWRH